MLGSSRARARVRRSVLVLVALAATSTFDAEALTIARDECAAVPLTEADWPTQNHDLSGTRANLAEATFSTDNVAGLQQRWRFDTPPGTQVYGTPAIAGGCVYAADSLGNVYSLSAADGSLNWVNHIGPVVPWINIVTASVTVSQDKVFVGDQGGTMHALDRATGDLV